MNKVGIVTITSGANYGNRLQNYAMQITLRKLGYNPYTIRKKDERKSVKGTIKKLVKHITGYKYTPLDKRIERFEKFNRKYICFSKNYIESDDYSKKLCDEFDYFICGSDQIWNPNYRMNTGCHFLSFVKGKNKISVSASLGIQNITESDSKRISKWMRELDAISVREKVAKDICEKIVGKKVSVLIDPTLMLDEEEWTKIAKKPKNMKNDDYILCYFLGSVNESCIADIKEYASNKKVKIVFLEDIWRNLGFSSNEEYTYDPSEFVWLISNSKFVITDSFHATVFSVIFKKKFIIVPRLDQKNNMNSRFDSLLEMFEIENAIYNKDFGIEQNLKVDYKKVKQILDCEKKKFCEFIISNL